MNRSRASWDRFPFTEYLLVLAIMIVLAIAVGMWLGAR